MDRKQQLYSAALELFVMNGFHGTPTAKIAQKAGVANGTLFNYFPTKEDLVNNLYTHIVNQQSEEIGTHLTANSVKDLFKQYYLAIIDWALKNQLQDSYIRQFKISPYFKLLKDKCEDCAKHQELLQKSMDYGLIQKLPIELIEPMVDGQIFAVHNYLANNDLTDYRKGQLIENSFEMLWRMLR